jgi:multisubunit Na+/H+ antiporter MnhB subunit
MKKIITFLLFIGLFIILSVNIMQMPSKFDTNAPAYNETTQHYIDHSLEDTGAVNIIAAILTDYRAFDTLGETIVLFTSIVAVVSILRVTDEKKKKEGDLDE